MSRASDELNCRAVALCSSRWGIAPPECRRLQAAGEITVDDFLATLLLAVIESPSTLIAGRPVLLEWLFPKSSKAKQGDVQKRLRDQFEALAIMDIPAEDPAAAADLKTRVLEERRIRNVERQRPGGRRKI